MGCTAHILGVQWQHHHWQHGVAWTEDRSAPLTDMWGRRLTDHYVACHKQDVCATCGAVRDGVDCSCDLSQAEHCVRRFNRVCGANE